MLIKSILYNLTIFLYIDLSDVLNKSYSPERDLKKVNNSMVDKSSVKDSYVDNTRIHRFTKRNINMSERNFLKSYDENNLSQIMKQHGLDSPQKQRNYAQNIIKESTDSEINSNAYDFSKAHQDTFLDKISGMSPLLFHSLLILTKYSHHIF